MANRDDHDESRRQVARRQRRVAGDRSARVAHALMQMSDSALDKLELDENFRIEVDRARSVTSPIARRRAERTLAGALRRVDIGDIEQRISSVEATGTADARLFHSAETWRARLIADDAAAAQFPGGNQHPLPELIARARRERDTGKPPGAARALFRHVLAALQAQAKAEHE